MSRIRWFAGALAVAALSACVPEEGPTMKPGEDCFACHGNGEGKAWTVAGTFKPHGATVVLSEKTGARSITLRTNQVGNFYTAESLTFPLRVSVDGREMPDDIVDWKASCNLCHGNAGQLAFGPNMLPGQDCLRCHTGNGGVVAFAAAGTFAPGRTVSITDATGATRSTTTNSVGNFYFAAGSLTLPLQRATLGGEGMANPGPSCNTCHGSGGAGGGD